MKSKTIIYGAGCQGRAILDILENDPEVELIGFIDDNKENRGQDFFGYKILGGREALESLIKENKVDAAIIGLGGFSRARKKIYDYLVLLGLKMINTIHPSAIISQNVKSMGQGNFIGAGAVIGPDVVIGNNTIINNCSCLSLDITIKDHVNVTPGVNFAAGIIVEEEAYLGIGSNIKQYVTIGKRAIIGGGAVVLQNVPENVVAVGVPAKVKKMRDD